MQLGELRQMLVEQLEDVTGRQYPRLEDADNLRESLGLDSVDLVTVIVQIQGNLGIAIRGEELENLVTVRDVLDLLQSKRAGASRPAA